MPRRAVLATVAAAVVLGGGVAPAVAGELVGLDEPTQVCVITDRDPQTGQRVGWCVWLPVEPPFSEVAAS